MPKWYVLWGYQQAESNSIRTPSHFVCFYPHLSCHHLLFLVSAISICHSCIGNKPLAERDFEVKGKLKVWIFSQMHHFHNWRNIFGTKGNCFAVSGKTERMATTHTVRSLSAAVVCCHHNEWMQLPNITSKNHCSPWSWLAWAYPCTDCGWSFPVFCMQAWEVVQQWFVESASSAILWEVGFCGAGCLKMEEYKMPRLNLS